MNLATVTAIILSTFGAIFLGMAALIKGMILGKLDDIKATLDDVRSEVHAIDIRVTRLEAENHFHTRAGD